MRSIFNSVLAAAVLAGACGGTGEGPEAAASPSSTPTDLSRPLPDPIPDIVARVNGRAIQLSEIVPLARSELRKLLPGQRSERTPEVMRLALQRYIDQELLVQEALDRGIEADTRAVEADYDQLRRDYPKDEEWNGYLANLGFTPQTFKAALRIRYTVQALIEETSDIQPPTIAEARALYEEDPKAFVDPETEKPRPFDAVADEALARVQKNRQDAFIRGLARGLRAKAKVEIYI